MASGPGRDDAPPRATGVDRRRLDELEHGLEAAQRRSVPAARPDERPAAYHPADEHQTVFALLGGTARKGSWEPAARVDCTALLGGIELDLREADLIEGTTTIRCFAFWGGINIVLPPDVDVVTDGTGILGGFDHVDHQADDDGEDVPLVRIEGVSVMSGVAVKIKERKGSHRKRWLGRSS